ncbi:MAG: alkaline phosphatase D family protein [Pseudomonadota bacterium]
MGVNRRGLLALLGAGAGATAAPAVAGTAPAWSFQHGVASGDPTEDSALIWTRLSWDGAGAAPQAVEVAWQAAADAGFEKILARGTAWAVAARDHTVKVEVAGLKPGATCFYRFAWGSTQSPVGRFRTLPKKTRDVVLAVASCALYPNGYFNAYGAIAALERVDAVVHLGDYIYEYGGPGSYGMGSPVAAERPHDPPHECVTLADYRRRHAQYKSDPQLQAAHARAAWITVWDDHETANDSFADGAENHDPDKGEGDWGGRKAAALKAYYEWMPIREPGVGRAMEMANRTFHFGDVASLVMVETRLTARSAPLSYSADLPVVDGKPDVAAFAAKWRDPARRLIGEEQHAWLAQTLTRSVEAGRTWQVIGNQVVMGKVAAPDFEKQLGAEKWGQVLAALDDDVKPRVARLARLAATGLPYNLDAWDGYPADRERVLATFAGVGARPIVLAGDSHTFWANELRDEAGVLRAAEFAATSITSPGGGDYLPTVPLNEGFEQRNEEVVYCDQSAKGFVLLTLTRDAARAEMVAVSTIHSRSYTTATSRRFTLAPIAGGGVSPLNAV